MKIRSSRKPFFSFESVAMTDIIMNIFIFFFISFSLLYTLNPFKESKIKVNLPKGATNVLTKGESPVVVNVTSQNEIFLGDVKVTLESLSKELSAYAENAKKNGLVVKADKKASVDYFVKVLDAARQAGIDKLGVSIELEEKNK